LRKNAEKFDRISDLLNRASVKFQGIILALAEVAAPKILAALEKFNKMDFAGIGQRFLAGLDIDGAKNLLMSAAKVVAAFLGNKMIQAIRLSASLFEVAFYHVSEKIAGRFGEQLIKAAKDAAEIMFFLTTGRIAQAMAKIQIATGKTLGEGAKTLEDKMLAAQKAFKDKLTKDDDPLGFKKATEDFDKAMSDIMAKGEKKLAKEKEKEKPKPNKLPTPVTDPGGRVFAKATEGPSRFAKPRSLAPSRDGLSGALTRYATIGAGSKLQTGGLGAKRYTNPAREAARIAKEQKKDVRDQTDILRDVDKKLGQGLAVN
jgi:hypothetical protein